MKKIFLLFLCLPLLHQTTLLAAADIAQPEGGTIIDQGHAITTAKIYRRWQENKAQYFNAETNSWNEQLLTLPSEKQGGASDLDAELDALLKSLVGQDWKTTLPPLLDRSAEDEQRLNDLSKSHQRNNQVITQKSNASLTRSFVSTFGSLAALSGIFIHFIASAKAYNTYEDEWQKLSDSEKTQSPKKSFGNFLFDWNCEWEKYLDKEKRTFMRPLRLAILAGAGAVFLEWITRSN